MGGGGGGLTWVQPPPRHLPLPQTQSKVAKAFDKRTRPECLPGHPDAKRAGFFNQETHLVVVCRSTAQYPRSARATCARRTSARPTSQTCTWRICASAKREFYFFEKSRKKKTIRLK